MKKTILTSVLAIILMVTITSCSSVQVVADYDKQVNFETFKTFAFYKPGIDKAEISDLDKRRILRAIERELMTKGLTKSENPDLLVSIIASSRDKIDVYNNYYGGYGARWGWNPYYYGNYNTVSTSTEGSLYIDLIDAKKKELIWQGQGVGYLNGSNMEQKEERINEFVKEIMAIYPPGRNK
ncbi:DUF4136 domain-containing protein [Bizionia argentinensis JUB59]|uniref:DUF4136 domain-containing protein n=1 Tax=Bizionia argentinensis JUB59 TaxID=1046627 RepID=G2EA82_9FLAO|nr:DUF4136 domain-containing protein [Bizionia argentinensis]EGV44663.1 DUF4136 domain-containing protein [Bizionia argentinensis JUB59]